MAEEVVSIGLMVFLGTKLVADAYDSPAALRLGQGLKVTILSLIVVLCYIAADRVHDIL